MNRDPALCRRFVRRTKDALRIYPDLKYNWSIDADEDHCILDFPVDDPDGFAVTVDVSADEVFVSFGRGHFHLEPDDTDEDIDVCVSVILDLLGPGMRLREKRSAGRPYSWTIERREGECWRRQEVVGYLLFNYFGRRSERIYQNNLILR